MDDRLPRLLRAALSEALALTMPIACAGCDEPDIGLCEACGRDLAPRPRCRSVDAPGGGFVVWSGLPFDAVTARVVRGIKEEGRTALTRSLGPALAAAVGRFDTAGAVLVPMPTSRASYRRRGYRVPDLLAARVGLPVASLLRSARRTRDQRGLGRAQRRQNVALSLRATDAATRRVIVVDDVVTTGATLAEAVRALRAVGADVVGAATVAATPLRMNGGDRPGVSIETHR